MRLTRALPRLLAISKDQEFMTVLKKMSFDSNWGFFEAASVNEAMNTLRQDSFPIVVLDQVVCERTWEACVSTLVQMRPVPCVLLASQYGDEYARLEMIRLGGYDVLNKSASPDVITRTIEFAWFWSQHAQPPLPSSAAISSPTRGPTQ